MREITKYQESVDFLIPRIPFMRLVREIVYDFYVRYYAFRFQAAAYDALQLASEQYLVELMKYSNLCAINSKRVTIMPKDLKLANKLLHVHNRPLQEFH